METSPVTCHTLEEFYHIDGHTFDKQYKRWYNKVEEARLHSSFNVIAATFYEHYDEILNFYNNRSSNALAETFNAKIKLFRANLRGVADKKFFLFRISKLYAYPH